MEGRRDLSSRHQGRFVAGCGGDDDSASGATPEEVVTDFYAATADQDAAAMCSLIDADTAEAAAQGEDSCEAGVESSFEEGTNAAAAELAEKIEVGEATIDGDTATIEVSADGQTEEVTAVQEDGEWKLSIAG